MNVLEELIQEDIRVRLPFIHENWQATKLKGVLLLAGRTLCLNGKCFFYIL